MGAKVRIRDERRRLVRAMDRANITSLGQAGAYIRGIAKRSIKVSPKPAPPGHPPHTRKGRLKNAILFGVEKAIATAVIGPAASAVGKVGSTHEFGGTEPPRKGRQGGWKLEVGGFGPVALRGGVPVTARLRSAAQVARAKEIALTVPAGRSAVFAGKVRKYPPRPFMGPALERSKARLPRFWARSVKGA